MPKQDKLDIIISELATIKEQNKNMAKDTEVLPEVLAKVREHEVTLYGRDSKSGLVGSNKLLMKAFWGAQALIVTGGAALSIFKDQIRDFLLKK
jgi:hypothetical protein